MAGSVNLQAELMALIQAVRQETPHSVDCLDAKRYHGYSCFCSFEARFEAELARRWAASLKAAGQETLEAIQRGIASENDTDTRRAIEAELRVFEPPVVLALAAALEAAEREVESETRAHVASNLAHNRLLEERNQLDAQVAKLRAALEQPVTEDEISVLMTEYTNPRRTLGDKFRRGLEKVLAKRAAAVLTDTEPL